MLLVIFPVPFAVVVHFRIFEEGHLPIEIVGEFAHPEAHLTEGGDAVPDIGEHAARFVEDDGGDVRGLVQGALPLCHGEVIVFHEHGYGGSAEMVAPDPVCDDAGHVEQGPVDVFGIRQVFRESTLRTAAFGFGHLGLDRGVVPSVGVLMQQDGGFLSRDAGQPARIQGGEFADGMDSVGTEPFGRFLAHPQQVPHFQRPHLGGDLFHPERMDLVRLFEVGGHLCEKLIGADAYVDGESQFPLDFILQARRYRHRVLPVAAAGHVDETFIDAELLQHR